MSSTHTGEVELVDPIAARHGFDLVRPRVSRVFWWFGVAGSTILLLYMLDTASFLPVAVLGCVGGIVIILVALRYATLHRESLPAALAAIAILADSSFLEGYLRAGLHYGLIVLFCGACIPLAWRSSQLYRGGFASYWVYFLWALITVSYSLEPSYSIARLAAAVLAFCTVSTVAFQVDGERDLTAIIEAYLVACGSLVMVVALAGLVLPHSLTWQAPDMFTENQSIERFRGPLGNPNSVGGLMFITVAPTLAWWGSFRRRQKMLFGVNALLAIAEDLLADSRTPLVALVFGGVLYALWKYRRRGIFVLLGGTLAMIAVLPFFGGRIADLMTRGNLTTLTGRTDIWQFVVGQIESKPLFGYGYEVAGAIFNSRYFPIWYGPWDQGAQSSLHNGYFDRAIGIGVPATLFWLFFALRPWVFALYQTDDPWNLKPVLFLVVLPALTYNLAESVLSDFLGGVGLLFGVLWGIAERYRQSRRNDQRAGDITMGALSRP